MKTKKMIIATATLLAAVGMGSGTAITQAGLGVDQASAKSVRHIATPKSYKKLAKKAVHVSKGNLYSSAKLSKISHKAKNYKHTTFYRTKQAKVVKANKKTAVYNYIKSSNGKTKGWIWHGYVKNGKAPKAKTSKSTTTLSKNRQFNKMVAGIKKNYADGHVNKLIDFLITKGNKRPGSLTDSHGYLKVANGTKKHMIDDYGYIGTLANGHRLLASTNKPKKNIEVMPGLHSNNETFTNNSGHWIAYYLADKNDDGIVAGHHKGFKYYNEMETDLANGFGVRLADVNSSGGSYSYNWKLKILLINKKAAENREYLNY